MKHNIVDASKDKPKEQFVLYWVDKNAALVIETFDMIEEMNERRKVLKADEDVPNLKMLSKRIYIHEEFIAESTEAFF